MAATAVSMVPCPLIMMTGSFGMTVRHGVQDVHAVELAALQPDIEDDQRRQWPGVDRLERRGTVTRGIARGVYPPSSRIPAIDLADVGFVVDDQDIA